VTAVCQDTANDANGLRETQKHPPKTMILRAATGFTAIVVTNFGETSAPGERFSHERSRSGKPRANPPRSVPRRQRDGSESPDRRAAGVAKNVNARGSSAALGMGNGRQYWSWIAIGLDVLVGSCTRCQQPTV